MVKILKEGKKVHFTKTCPECDCEFEYSVKDVEVDYSLCLTSIPPKYHRYITCPWCGKKIYHDTIAENELGEAPKIFYSIPTSVPSNTPTTITSGDCSDCIYYQQVLNDPSKANQAGDSPCTWCKKMQVTCASSGPKLNTINKNEK